MNLFRPALFNKRSILLALCVAWLPHAWGTSGGVTDPEDPVSRAPESAEHIIEQAEADSKLGMSAGSPLAARPMDIVGPRTDEPMWMSLGSTRWRFGKATAIRETSNRFEQLARHSDHAVDIDLRVAQQDKDTRGTQPKSIEDLFSTEDNSTSTETANDSVEGLFGLEEEQPEEGSNITGYYQNELAYTYPDRDHFSKFRNTLQLGARGDFSDRISWQASGRVLYDPIYDLDDFYPEEVEDDQEFEAQIRDTFLDIAGDIEFRLGRQHIVWGEVLGFFIADVVSARDLRDFRATDLDQLRIPQWAVRGEYFKGDLHAEAIWIPYMTYDDIGEFGAEFFPLQASPPPGFGLRVVDEDKPKGLSESAAGLRISYLFEGWDASLFYYTSMDRSPAFQRTLIQDPDPLFTFRAIHERIHQVGGTLTKDLGNAVFKAEAVYTMDRLFEVRDPSNPEGLVDEDKLDYLFSLEFVFAEDTRLNVQFIQQWIPDHDSTMVQDNVDSNLSLFASTRAAHPSVEPQLFVFRNLDRTEWLLRANVLWEINRNWYVNFGIDIFEGSDEGIFDDRESGLIGQFDAKDRVFYELRYTF